MARRRRRINLIFVRYKRFFFSRMDGRGGWVRCVLWVRGGSYVRSRPAEDLFVSGTKTKKKKLKNTLERSHRLADVDPDLQWRDRTVFSENDKRVLSGDGNEHRKKRTKRPRTPTMLLLFYAFLLFYFLWTRTISSTSQLSRAIDWDLHAMNNCKICILFTDIREKPNFRYF